MGLPDVRCVVVGAGIGGLATALSLEQIGVRCVVFDAVSELRPLGVGINLLPHAVRELDELGLLGELQAHSVAPSLLLYATRRGQEIWSEPRGLAAGYPWPQLSIHRGVLQEVLLGAVIDRLGRDAVQLGRRLERVDHDPHGQPAAVFEDGRVGSDIVVAADGIHSAARRQHYPAEGRVRWNGSLLWRGVAETAPILDGRTMVWAGHPEQKFVGYPIADLPDGRQAFNFVAELHRPESDLATAEDWNRSGSLDDFLPEFAGWDFGWLDVPALVRAAPETYLFPMVDRDPVDQWTFGRSTLLGDAAHPMYPIGSNGASQAILDARRPRRVPPAPSRRHRRGSHPIRRGTSPGHRGDRPGESRARTRGPDAPGRTAGPAGILRDRGRHHPRRDRPRHRGLPKDRWFLARSAPRECVAPGGAVPRVGRQRRALRRRRINLSGHASGLIDSGH